MVIKRREVKGLKIVIMMMVTHNYGLEAHLISEVNVDMHMSDVTPTKSRGATVS